MSHIVRRVVEKNPESGKNVCEIESGQYFETYLMKTTLEIPEIKTSDRFECNLPKRFDNPHWFQGYGIDEPKEHPFYTTSSKAYGFFPPNIFTVARSFHPAWQTFTNALAAAGMYRDYRLHTVMDCSCKEPNEVPKLDGKTWNGEMWDRYYTKEQRIRSTSVPASSICKKSSHRDLLVPPHEQVTSVPQHPTTHETYLS